jgi:hypothetical protein
MEVLTDFSVAQTVAVLAGSFALGWGWGVLVNLVFRIGAQWMG